MLNIRHNTPYHNKSHMAESSWAAKLAAKITEEILEKSIELLNNKRCNFNCSKKKDATLTAKTTEEQNGNKKAK